MNFKTGDYIAFLLINVNNHISLDHFSEHQNLKEKRALLLRLQIDLILSVHIVPVGGSRASLLREPVPPFITSSIVMDKLHFIFKSLNVWRLWVPDLHLENQALKLMSVLYHVSDKTFFSLSCRDVVVSKRRCV